MKKLVNSALLLLCGSYSFAQTQIVMDAASDGTTVNTCFGGLYDSGGTGGAADYQNGESYVVTICPDVPGDFITLLWTTFNLDCTDNVPGPGSDADNITIYDGPNTGSPTLGTYTCGALGVGDIFGASSFNPSGCLTIEFNSNANGTGNYTAQVSCETPCDPPTANGIILNADSPSGDSIAVCIDEVVDFQDFGSTPGGSGLFTLTKWVWHWFDGSPDDTLYTAGATISHAFSQPGQYVVQLEVIDDNGCSNNNATDIEVFVTTYPTFDPFPGDTTICLGESLTLSAFPNAYEVEWSGFPVGVWVPDNCMEDLTGILQTTPLTITGYDSNISLDNAVPDVFSICVDMEHSFMGDFVLQIQCPTGQVMTLHQQGGGGCYIGNPVDNVIDCDDPSTFGTPAHYCFTATAAQTWVGYVTSGGACPLPPGDYLPVDPNGFAALDGCPVNGTWQMLFTDLWGADDGSMPGWEINFNPILDPPVTVFTPQIGLGPDSSYWDLTDQWITSSTPDADNITILPGASGTFLYDYTVVNSFGCSFDSTVTITVTDNPPANAGLDTTFCGAGLVSIGAPAAQCGNDSGNYTYCYDDNEFTTFTYCPDNPGDGLTFMSISFNAGSTETWFDFVTIYDGNNTGAPVIAGPMDGNLAGLSWQATNPTGCITMLLTTDGSVSCQSGSTIAFDYDVTCGGGGPSLVYSWIPNDGSLDNVNIPNPTVINPNSGTTTYTLTVYPVGHPDCIMMDDVDVSISGGLDAGTDSMATFCFEGPPEDLFTYLGGTPDPDGDWYDPSGNPITMPITPATSVSGLYEYRRDSAGCTASAFIDVTIFTLQGATLVTDADCGNCNGQVALSSLNGVAPLQYSNDAGATFQAANTFTGLCGSPAPGTNYSFLIEDAQGCQVTVDDDVSEIMPTLNPPVVANTSCYTVCDGSITLTGTGLAAYQITSSGGTVTNNITGVFTGLCADTYDILVDNGFGCTLTSTATITQPTALQITSLTPDLTICAGDPASLNVTGTGGNGSYTFTWTQGLGGPVLGTGTTLNLNPNNSMQVCVTMSENCPSPTVTQCMNITVPSNAFPLMTSDVTSGCYPVNVAFTNLTAYPNIATTEWAFSDGGVMTVNGSAGVSHSFSAPGLYDVTMTVTTIEGCVFDTTFVQFVEVFEYPNAMFTYTPIPATIFDTEITFGDFSSEDVTTWLWDFGPLAAPSASNEEQPTVVYPEGVPGDYPVMLYVWNANNCIDSIMGVVNIVNEVVIFAPNIFTPDGDEFNEGWRIYIQGIDIYDFHLTMFNRWGEVVWESYNSEGVWNGKYGSREIVQDGTYIWVLEAKDTYNDKKYEFRGHVTVLK
jgi:gliding motility-associated-like protein